jgi:hypothetical protein
MYKNLRRTEENKNLSEMKHCAPEHELRMGTTELLPPPSNNQLKFLLNCLVIRDKVQASTSIFTPYGDMVQRRDVIIRVCKFSLAMQTGFKVRQRNKGNSEHWK